MVATLVVVVLRDPPICLLPLEHMFDRADGMGLGPLGHTRDEIKGLVAGFEPGTLTGAQAVAMVEVANEIENLARLVKAKAARRVAELDEWRRSGAASAKEYLAGKTGESAGQVAKLVDTATKVDELSETRDAVESGEVSLDQAAVIASAVAAAPGCEQALVDTAKANDLAALRHDAAAAKAAADRDHHARHRRLRRQRRLRTWVDDDGMGNVSWRTTIDEYQAFLALHQRFREAAFKAAYRAGRRDPDPHLASDAMARLVTAATTGGGSTRRSDGNGDGNGTGDGGAGDNNTASSDAAVPKQDVRVLIHVTDTALLRGHTHPGETCEITGVGPVSVTEARRVAGTNPFVSLVETDGIDVRRVVRLGRRRPPEIDDALLVRDRSCVVPGCTRTARLEIHHTIPYATTGHTTLDELATVCCHHHDLITHRGYRLTGGPGTWTWHPPAGPPQDGPPGHGAPRRSGQLVLDAS
jgi:hypothetical protein